MKREYLLMNRTQPMLRFSCERNAFDEPEFAELAWLTALRPIGYHNLYDFLGTTSSPGGRRPSTAGISRNCWNATAATIWRALSASRTR